MSSGGVGGETVGWRGVAKLATAPRVDFSLTSLTRLTEPPQTISREGMEVMEVMVPVPRVLFAVYLIRL
jgi:hypothetical protein